MTPAQCSAARSLLRWSVDKLAARVGVSPTTIRNFEGGRTKTQPLVVKGLRDTFVSAGVVFKEAASDKQISFAKVTKIELEDGSSVALIRD